MALIKTVETGLYRIPLTVTLSDSTHGEIAAFELVTCRVYDSDGAEGTGYTYTVGRNGGAIADILRREIPELIEGREADDTESGIISGGACITAGAADRRCWRYRRSISPCGT
jgi:L-alanine-DL-glutamate epimerase-like enolase superfamily enzyme